MNNDFQVKMVSYLLISYCFCKKRGSLFITSSTMIAISTSEISRPMLVYLSGEPSLSSTSSLAVTLKTIGWHKSTSPIPIPC